MRSLAIFLLILVIIIGGAALFLVMTTPHAAAPARVPPALIGDVPSSAEWFAIIPHAAALDGKLRANAITNAAIEKWRATHPLPRPWMLGGADLIVWKSGDAVRYFVRLDPFRAFVVRLFGLNNVQMLPPQPGLDAAAASQIEELAAKLPPGDALVVQRENARGSFPPIARPAVTSVVVTRDEIRLTSVAAGDAGRASARPDDGLKPVPHFPETSFPNGAVLSVAYATSPRVMNDLNRLFGQKVSDLFADGGMLCIYDVDFRKLLPRPLGVIVVPDDAARHAAVASLHDIVRTGQKDGMLLLSFDHSIDQYEKDVFEQPAEVGNEWTMRIEAPRLVPILKDFGQNLGARVLAPRLYRSARDLDQWLSGLEQAKVIDAAASADPGGETLRVRITAK
jgi:hypothetical protein